MPVNRDDFRVASGLFTSLQPLATDRSGNITAIAVTIGGIEGKTSNHRTPVTYRVLASVQNLQAELPTIWIASPEDSRIRHVNIFRASQVCPFTGTRLPTVCWGQTPTAWRGTSTGDRRLANLLEAVRQVLAQSNPDSPAR